MIRKFAVAAAVATALISAPAFATGGGEQGFQHFRHFRHFHHFKYVAPVVEAPAASAPAASAPAQQPTQNASGGSSPQYAAYVMLGILAQYTIWVVCEKENIEWCKAPEWFRGPITAPTPGEFEADPFWTM